MAEVRAMVDKYGATELFVASDDDEALAEIAGIEGLRVMSTPHDRSMLRSDWYVEDRIRHGLLDAAIAGDADAERDSPLQHAFAFQTTTGICCSNNNSRVLFRLPRTED